MVRAIQATAVCVTVLVATAGTIQAAMITGFDIPQNSTGYSSINPISGGSPYVATTSLSHTPTLGGSAFSNHFYTSNWDTTVNLTKYYTTTLTVDAGKELSLTDLTYSIEDSSNHSPGAFSTFHVRTSLDNFATDVDSFPLANNFGLVVDRTTDLSSLGGITGAIEFRFYATTQTPSLGISFANHLVGGSGGGLPDTGQNIRFHGSVADISAVPEPSSIGLFVVGACVIGVGAARRRHREKQASAV